MYQCHALKVHVLYKECRSAMYGKNEREEREKERERQRERERKGNIIAFAVLPGD